MTFTQLNPTLPVYVTQGGKFPQGEGYAIAVIDSSQEHHLLWVIAYDDGGEIWSVPNPFVRLQNNPSLMRDFKHPTIGHNNPPERIEQ
jgi:hypothetical protein